MRNPLTWEAVVALVLIALDPGTQGDDCPAVFLDTATGDLVFQGPTVVDPGELAEVNKVSRIKPDESLVRLPERMRAIIRRALVEVDGDQVEEDPVR
jgi:hypothetical protein